MTTPDQLPAGSFPVITVDGVRVGHVYPDLGDDHFHWGTVDANGYRSPYMHTTSQAAREHLLDLAGSPNASHIDTPLIAKLARLGEVYGPVDVAVAAAFLTDRSVVVARLTTAGATPAPPGPDSTGGREVRADG